MTKEWRKDKKNEEEEDFAFFFIVVIINKKSCGSEGRGVGWIRLNQKFTWGGGGGGIHNDKKQKKSQKIDNHTKITNTKNQKYGEKSFIQRTCKYWSYPGPGLYCYFHTTYIHTHTCTHTPIHSASTHHVCVCSCVSYRFACWITLNDFQTSAV